MPASGARSTTTRTGPTEPRIGTPRDPARKTIGGRLAKFAEALGEPFMPWQRHVADVAGEIDPDTGDLVYKQVVILVPRQSGKTTLVRAVLTDRCAAPKWGGKQRVVYTAQTRQKAREKWEEDHVAALEQAAAFRGLFEVRRAKGEESIRWGNRSVWAIDASNANAAHGGTNDVGVIDEAWSQEDGTQEGAILPTMTSRDSPQLWIPSTAGTLDSKYLKAKVDSGRRRAELGEHGSVAYFEYSAADDDDPDDPETWIRCMPALGYTQSLRNIRGAHESMQDNPAEWERAFLNRWRGKATGTAPVDLEHWAACADADAAPAGRVVLALDVSPLRTEASITATGRTAAGDLVVEVIYSGPAGDHLYDLLDAARALLPAPVVLVVDGKSPAASMIPTLRATGWTVMETGADDMADACGDWWDKVTYRRLKHRDDPRLNAQVEACRTRRLGDKWALSRQNSSTEITAAVSMVLSLYGFLRGETSTPDRYDALASVY